MLFGFFKRLREKREAKKRAKASKKLAQRIDRQSQAVLNRVMQQTQWVRDEHAIFEACYPLYLKGEEARKSGDAYTAIEFFEQARQRGYHVPALYESYAKAYRKMNDIPNEIAIIEEGIARLSDVNGIHGDMSTGIRNLSERLEKVKAKLK